MWYSLFDAVLPHYLIMVHWASERALREGAFQYGGLAFQMYLIRCDLGTLMGRACSRHSRTPLLDNFYSSEASTFQNGCACAETSCHWAHPLADRWGSRPFGNSSYYLPGFSFYTQLPIAPKFCWRFCHAFNPVSYYVSIVNGVDIITF